MKKDALLQYDIEKILIDMQFIDLYKTIWENHREENEHFKISDGEIINVFKGLNFEVKKYGKDQFFTDWYLEDGFEYRIGITIKFNMIHFDFSVKNEKIGINSGCDFGLLLQLITNWQMPVKSPSFDNLKNFNLLIQDLVALYTNIKLNIKLYFDIKGRQI